MMQHTNCYLDAIARLPDLRALPILTWPENAEDDDDPALDVHQLQLEHFANKAVNRLVHGTAADGLNLKVLCFGDDPAWK